MKESDAKKFTIKEVSKYIQESVKQIEHWEKNLKDWKEVLSLLQDTNPEKE